MSGEPNWRGYADELDTLESEIDALQTQKQDIYVAVREIHGKVKADALKAAMRIRRMKPEKREAAAQVEAETELMLEAINAEPRAPRATRTRERQQDRTLGAASECKPAAVQASSAPAEPAADEGSAPIQAGSHHLADPQVEGPEGEQTAIGSAVPSSASVASAAEAIPQPVASEPPRLPPATPHGINPHTRLPMMPEMPSFLRRERAGA